MTTMRLQVLGVFCEWQSSIPRGAHNMTPDIIMAFNNMAELVVVKSISFQGNLTSIH